MKYSVAGSLLEACVLGLVATKPTYGYELTQRAKAIIEVSESTLYPVLRRLQKEGLLSTFDKPFAGRNRRYYEITKAGREQLEDHIDAWHNYVERIDTILIGKETDE